MKRTLKVVIPILLVLFLIASLIWYLMVYDPAFTKDFLLDQARNFEAAGEHNIAEWIYGLAYDQSSGGDEVAIELAQYYIDSGNYTKAEYTLSNAIADGGSVNLYIALCRTYVEQDKLLDAVTMLNNIADPAIKAELDAIRPAAPTATPDPNFYSQYISVTISAPEGTLYISTDEEYPSIGSEPYAGPITLPGGVTTISAIAVGENMLVSPLSVFGYTIGGVIEAVEFQDKTLEDFIRTTLNVGSRTIYSDELWTFTELELPENTTTFADLALFPYLNTLIIHDCEDKDLSVLSSLKELKSLTIHKGSINRDNLSAIGTLHHLESLTLKNCGLTSIAALSNLTKLTYLDLSGNTLRNIDIFAGMKNLQQLYMSGNAMTDLTAIAGLKEMTVLDVSMNSLQSLVPVNGLTKLHTLLAGDNAIASIEGLGALKNLQILTLNQNELTDISPIASCLELTELNVSNNTIEDVAFLSAHTKIAKLNISHNAVLELPVFDRNCALMTIDASYNLLVDIDELELLKNLNTVNVEYNEAIETLEPLANNFALVQVNCYGTKVSDVTFLTEKNIVVNYNPSGVFN